MVPAAASGRRGLRRFPAPDRQPADDLPAVHRRADDRRAPPPPDRPRAGDRDRLRLPDLLVEAEERFRRLGLTNIETRLGDGAAGWPERAPFDGIMVTAAAPHVPDPLVDQLAPEGRLVIPVGDLASQELVVLERSGSRISERRIGGVRFVPLISRHAFT